MYAKISLDDSAYNKGISEATKSGNNFADSLGKGLKTAAKVGAAAITAAAAGIVALTKASIENYAQYEQLVGGVETLFKGSADTVMGYAENAYKTAGMSANDYLSTVTSFSASLLQSLGGDTEAAANKADMAVTDMADNANKMGTSVDLIQNAYQGFAKQNYMMLDNLKLGYGGTKEEMERLLADAEKISGIKYDVSSYGDIVDAIHVVQTEMGITGTTAEEASKTISGSFSAMKAAWQNLLTGIADPKANLTTLIDNLVESAETAMSNLLPAVSTAILGIGKLITTLAPKIINTIVGILPQLVPVAVQAIMVISNAIINNLPIIFSAGISIILALANGIVENLNTIVPAVVDIIIEVVDILTSPESITQLLAAALQIVLALAKGLIESLPKLLEKAPEIIGNLLIALVNALPVLWDAGTQIIEMIGNAISSMFSSIVEWGMDIINSIGEGIKSTWDSMKDYGRQTINKLWEGITEAWESVENWFSNAWDSLFGNKTVTVTGEVVQKGRSSAGGLDYVPYNGYPVRAHLGEAVLTADEAEKWRSGSGMGNGVVINQSISAVPQSATELADATLAAFQRARWIPA